MNTYGRVYRYKVKKLKVRRRLIALAVAAAIGTGAFVLANSLGEKTEPIQIKDGQELFFVGKDSVNTTEDEYLGDDFIGYIQEEIPEVNEESIVTVSLVTPLIEESSIPTTVNTNYSKGDSVIATTNVNLRLNASKDSFKLGELPKEAVVNRILSVGNWDLVRYGDIIAYVCNDYTRTYDVDYNNEYYYVVEESDIVRTTTKLYFRLGPSTNEQSIDLLDKNEELEVIAKVITYADENDIWYLVKRKGRIGFVNAGYTKSLKETLKQQDPEITDLSIEKIGYVKNYSNLYDNHGNVIKSVDTYQLVKILDDKDNYYLVEYGSTVGLIEKSNVKTYSGVFAVVDLSDQTVCLYCNADMVFESFCTTGADKTPTRTGAFTVSEATNSRYFSETAQAREMWRRFDNGNGFHDAPWEPESKFGSQSYRKKSGSKGCVRLPDAAARFLKNYIKVGTHVIVKD